MKKFIFAMAWLVSMSLPVLLSAGSSWPREVPIKDGKVILYQPQTDSLRGDHLYSRIAISITAEQRENPIFGAIWTDSRFSTDRDNGTCTIFNVKVMNVRFPGIDTIDKALVQKLKTRLEEEATSWNIEFSLEEIKSSLEITDAAVTSSANFNNNPPEIIFLKNPSMLVLFDGDPVWKETGTDGPKRAINTPFLVLQDTRDKQYYLFAGEFWFKSADAIKSPWGNVTQPSAQVKKYYDALVAEMKKSGSTPEQTATGKKPAAAPVIVVRTKPSELIQSTGEPQYAPIEGTGLLYMTNTTDNIFMTIDKNMFYVLLSGRWYTSAALSGPWAFVASDKLPADFARIPEGTAKDIVLASVAGTPAAKEAVLDAQIPQTAAVDRKSAKCEVKWDGDPKFEKIKGTELSRGMNTSSTVLLFAGTYYVCDNAVWFAAKAPTGPWEVAIAVPNDVQKIPPDDPAYNVKYVYIYDVQPEVVYVGYTPGYTGCYVYGPTIVYGTGWPYPPFYGPYYYPRPVTYGFSMHYNPWYGFSMGFTVSNGIFSVSVGGGGYGWWGPPMYRPPYGGYYNHYYGSRPPVYRGGGNTINIDNSRNIYTNRPDRSTRPSQLPATGTRPSARPGTGSGQQPGVSTRPATGDRTGNKAPSTRPADKTSEARPADRSAGQNNVYSDRDGNVYRNNKGEWQKNNGKTWESAQPTNRGGGTQAKPADRSGFNQQEMNRQNQARERGTQNSMNRSSVQQRSAPSGGARTGGGGGGGGRRR